MTTYPEMSTQELRQLEESLKPFFKPKKLTDGKTYNILDVDAWMIAQGCRKHKNDYMIAYSPLYGRLENMLEQLSKFKAKREYAKDKMAEELAASN